MAKFKWLIVFVGLGLVLAIVWPAFRSWQNERRVADTKRDLTNILQALHSYHDRYHTFPPAFVVGPDGRRWHSWRALILHDIAPQLAATYRFDEPWDGPHNSQLHDRAPQELRSEFVSLAGSSTSYFAVVGRKTMWPAHQSIGFRNIWDGTSNTLAVVEDQRTDICWLEPRDLLPGEFHKSFYQHKSYRDDGLRTVALADGSVRNVDPETLDSTRLGSLLTPAGGMQTYKGDDWPQDLCDEVPVQSFAKRRDAANLNDTEVVPVATVPLKTHHNQLWCVSFQLAWDVLKNNIGGPVTPTQPLAVFDELNQFTLDRRIISPDAFFTAVTNGSSDQDANMLRQLRNRFPDVEMPLTPVPQDAGWAIRTVAAVRKQMPFESRLSRFKIALPFGDTPATRPVNSFGVEPNESASGPVFSGQVQVADDRGDDNVIIRLNTINGQRDQILLAMIPPEATLQKTWEAVLQRMRSPNPKHTRFDMEAHETLQIPVLDFSIESHFAELEGVPLAGLGDDARIESAFQMIQLRLDETGADFTSTAEVMLVGAFGEEEFDPQRIRRFVFEKPFFVAIKEPSAPSPWFMAWIANSTLMDAFAR